MNVTLKPEIVKLIADGVEAGRSAGVDEFLNNAVYHYVVARDLGQEYTSEETESHDCRRSRRYRTGRYHGR